MSHYRFLTIIPWGQVFVGGCVICYEVFRSFERVNHMGAIWCTILPMVVCFRRIVSHVFQVRSRTSIGRGSKVSWRMEYAYFSGALSTFQDVMLRFLIVSNFVHHRQFISVRTNDRYLMEVRNGLCLPIFFSPL